MGSETLALLARESWMRQMGLSDDEVREGCDPVRYPADLKEELESLAAIADLEVNHMSNEHEVEPAIPHTDPKDLDRRITRLERLFVQRNSIDHKREFEEIRRELEFRYPNAGEVPQRSEPRMNYTPNDGARQGD